MNVEEYIELRKKELDAFAEFYNKGIKNSPDTYPKEFSEGDWFDQELAYIETQE